MSCAWPAAPRVLAAGRGGLGRRCWRGCGAGADVANDEGAPSGLVVLAPGGTAVEGVPATVPQFDPGGAVAVGHEPDLDLGPMRPAPRPLTLRYAHDARSAADMALLPADGQGGPTRTEWPLCDQAQAGFPGAGKSVRPLGE
jgi:hypothetical protein